jgi:hypothetical protein
MGGWTMYRFRTMHHRGAILAVLALIVLGAAATAAPARASTIYVDPEGRFALDVADGWVQRQPDTRGVLGLWTVDGGAAIFNVVREDVPFGTSSVDYAKANVAGVSSLSGYQEIRRDFITCADQNCPLLERRTTRATWSGCSPPSRSDLSRKQWHQSRRYRIGQRPVRDRPAPIDPHH